MGQNERKRLLAIAALILFAAAVSASELPSPLIESPPLSIGFNAAAGSLRLSVTGEEVTTEIPGMFIDGVLQERFARADDGSWRNPSAVVEFSVLAPGVIAATWTSGDGKRHDFRLRLRSDDETAYYGGGERFNALNQRGYILPVRVDDRYGNKGVGTHKPVPFFMSSRGFGVWIDTFAPGILDLSGSERFNTDLQFAGPSFRAVFIAGPSLAQILERFTALTGRSPVPPPWAFGLWKSRDVHRNREEVLEDVEKLRRFGIPASVIVLDSPWETGYNDFEINREQFTNADAMFRRVRELGFHLALWLTPFINSRNVMDMKGIAPKSKNFDEAASRGYLVRDADGKVALSEWWKGTGGLIDFTNPEAKEWWFAQLRKTRRYGAQAFKADDGEGNFVPEAVFHDRSSSAEMKNRYSILYNQAMQEYVDRELGGDGVLIVRSGHTGVQKFPFSWAGDNRADFSFEDGLPSVIVAAQNAAFSGISLWGSDIAGYAGTPDKELFIRWTQFAVFTPFMQVHMTSNLGPWDFDAETLEIFRQFAVLRSQLFPYLYELAHQSSRTGMPVIRPMALAFPADAEARRQIHQFLFGPDFLVAPIYQPGTTRSVYLPEGTWYDFWTHQRHEGPKMLEVRAALDRMPLFVRGGAIVPMLPPDVQTLVPRSAEMSGEVTSMDARRILQVWPGTSGRMSTWDGIRASLDGATLRIESDQARELEVQLVGRELAEGAEVAGATARAGPGMTVLKFGAFRGTRSIPLR